jgi:hypothetical protein
MAKADDLQGDMAQVEKVKTRFIFSNTTIAAAREVNKTWLSTVAANHERSRLPTPPGISFETIERNGFETQITLGGLNKLATYSGEGWWTVSLSSLGEWRINEVTEAVQAKDRQAKSFLEKVALNTYKNQEYGYEVDYRRSWTVDDGEKRAVLISSPNLDEEFAVVVVDRSEESAAVMPVLSALVDDLPSYIQARVRILEAGYYDFEVTDQSATSLEFVSRNFESAQQWGNRLHFTQSNGTVYEILSSKAESSGLATAVSEWQGFSLIYDASRNFRLHP